MNNCGNNFERGIEHCQTNLKLTSLVFKTFLSLLFNPITRRQNFRPVQMKQIADGILKCIQNEKSVSYRVENIVRKGEIACNTCTSPPRWLSGECVGLMTWWL